MLALTPLSSHTQKMINSMSGQFCVVFQNTFMTNKTS